MPVTQETIKRLFGSAVHCAAPDCPSPLVVRDRGRELVVVEIAHIRSGQRGGPRFDPAFDRSRLDLSGNLLLLCRTHHVLVDRGEYPLEELLLWKAEQERQTERMLEAAGTALSGDLGISRHLQDHAARRELYVEIAQALDDEVWAIVRERHSSDPEKATAQRVAARRHVKRLDQALAVLGPSWLHASFGAPLLALIAMWKYPEEMDDGVVKTIQWFNTMAAAALRDPDTVPDLSDCPVRIRCGSSVLQLK